ncbi:hypothetical protein PFICI_04149 [Pestalotiopsis fici W106-1]|uniref:Carbohydrate kinase PfkB domain-containing protein n=1 Tax=Pestalotiopsis fici (strain W106-1 / CGMCC3.15140) TaxID=1229662 RepID=W3XJC1_PESFW|nr:uncharacterized protein PFICI_04149 [Pestalotiopsis fici W106-1]ETS86124.1 hypothetical protein PFICI_04149 [Pestalotiopsis fici W106-1]
MAPSSIDFVSLGMIVLDELRLPDGRVLHDCVGGSGAYSTLGARLTAAAQPDTVGSLIVAGNDFPDAVAELIRSWGVSLDFIVKDGKSTRGLLEYHDAVFGRKSFRYLTEPLQPVASSLTQELLSSRSFHMLYRPAQLVTEVKQLKSLRSALGVAEIPVIVWEPFPALCSLANLQIHIEACKEVDIFSPNHHELLGLFHRAAEPFDFKVIESCARQILNETDLTTTSKRHYAVVVRAGEHGCHIVSQQSTFWLPPFYTDSSSVVDATGGGNTFLGAFAITLARTSDIRAAAIAGSVAASFAIEQIGIPHRTTENSEELWNSKGVLRRFEDYTTRLK